MRAAARDNLRRWVLLAPIVIAQFLAGAAAGDDRAAFRAAVEEADARYRAVMRTIETRGREETSAELARFREAWQAVIERLKSTAPDDEQQAALLFQVESRIVGAMIVIDIGSRDAARAALIPIGETLGQLRNGAPRR